MPEIESHSLAPRKLDEPAAEVGAFGAETRIALGQLVTSPVCLRLEAREVGEHAQSHVAVLKSGEPV